MSILEQKKEFDLEKFIKDLEDQRIEISKQIKNHPLYEYAQKNLTDEKIKLGTGYGYCNGLTAVIDKLKKYK